MLKLYTRLCYFQKHDLSQNTKFVQSTKHADTNHALQTNFFTRRKMLDLINWLEEDLLKHLTPFLLQKYPNTYAYTKCLTEQLVSEYMDKVPIAVARPSISKFPHVHGLSKLYKMDFDSHGGAAGTVSWMGRQPERTHGHHRGCWQGRDKDHALQQSL